MSGSKHPEYRHVPVLSDEVIKALNPGLGQKCVDMTVGGGGYLLAIARKVGPQGLVVGFDVDPAALRCAGEAARAEGLGNIVLIQANFKYAKQEIFGRFGRQALFDSAVFDLGVSSYQLEDASRGFSFRIPDAPLVMAMSGADAHGRDAAWIVNNAGEAELADIIWKYGEERFSRRIARKIIEARKRKPIRTAGELAEAVSAAVPKPGRTRARLHPATRTFQAIRIAVNSELDNLENALPQALDLLKPGGRLAVVSFHSLEDRIVKDFMRRESARCICPPETMICACAHEPRLKVLTKKPIVPGEEEIEANPRSRSAKLRLAEKITI